MALSNALEEEFILRELLRSGKGFALDHKGPGGLAKRAQLDLFRFTEYHEPLKRWPFVAEQGLFKHESVFWHYATKYI